MEELEQRKREIEKIKIKNIYAASLPKVNRMQIMQFNFPPDIVDEAFRELEGEIVETLEQKHRKKIQEDAQLRGDVLELFAAKKKSQATEKIVKRILQEEYIYTTRDDNKEEVWIYNNGVYVPHGRTFVKEIVRQILGDAFSVSFYNEVLAKIEADTYIEIENLFKIKNKEEIAVSNGILNIGTKELTNFSPTKIFFNKLPVTYNPRAECNVVESFLKDVLSDSADINVFYELGGFALLKEYSFEKAFMFVGDGRNGKGKTIELIKRVIGAENCYSLPLSVLTSENADVSGLFGKMINIAGDIGNADLKETGMFKALTGRDLITAKRKYLSAISFENYAKFIFACNELPMVYDLSKGFWDRWVLLEFPYYFATKEEFEYADEERKKLMRIRDENIIDKISSADQLSGLLNKFLEGLDRLIKNGRFSSTKGTEDVKNTWIRKSNSMMAFAMDKIKEDYQGRISKQEFRKRYSDYCKAHKVPGKSDIVIKRIMQEMFGADEIQTTSSLGNYQERFWGGISWK